MNCTLIANNPVDTQSLRFLVVFQDSVSVEGGSIVHLLHIRTRPLSLRGKRVHCKHSHLTVSVTKALWGLNCLLQSFKRSSEWHLVIWKNCLLTVTETDHSQPKRFVFKTQEKKLWSLSKLYSSQNSRGEIFYQWETETDEKKEETYWYT